jgi:O-antigen ligase
MTVTAVQERFRLIAIWSWGLMAFCLPFSTALTLIFSAFGVLFGLVGFDWASLKIVMRHPIVILCVVLFAWLALSMLWSIAPRDEMIEGISKYRKLLYVPLVAMLLVSTRVKPWFLMNFFVAGCLVVCVGSLFSSSGLAGLVLGPPNAGGGWLIGGTAQKAWFLLGSPEKPTFGRANIAQGAFLIIAATYIFGHFFNQTIDLRKECRRRILSQYLVVMALLVYVTLNLGGLTGYILLVATFAIWILYLTRRGFFRSGVSLLVIAITAIFLALNYNASVKQRVLKSIDDYTAYIKTDAMTSEGMRLSFWKSGIRYGIESPILGSGVGSYAEVYARDESNLLILRLSRPHPHSEPVLQLVQGGMVALLIWALLILNFCAILIQGIYKLDSVKYSILIAIALILLDGFFNSVVWDLAEGHAFALMTATWLSCCSKNR